MKTNFTCHYYVITLLEIQTIILYEHNVGYRVN